MTEKEFIQRSAIAMAGNPNFADGDGNLMVEGIVMEADRLASELDSLYLNKAFDDDGYTCEELICDNITAIRNAIAGSEDDGAVNLRDTLEEIRKYMNNPDDKARDLSALQEIAKNLWDIEGHQQKLEDLHVTLEE